MSDSISLKVAFPNYKKYSDPLKSFINFFMSYSNLYMKLTPKDTSVNTTPVSVSGGIYEDGVFKIIGSELVQYIGTSVRLQNCVLIQTAIGEITGEEPVYEPIVIDGTYTVTEENSAGVINVPIDDEPSPSYTWGLNRDDLNPKFVPVVECDLSACIKLDSTKVPFIIDLMPGSDLPDTKMPVPTSDVFIPFTSNYKSSFTVSEEFIPEVASTFSVVDTALSLYDFPEPSVSSSEENDGEIIEEPEPESESDAQSSNSENTLAYNSSFSLPCKLIPYVNGNPNTDASYIPYDAVETQNVYTAIDIPDSSNITYQLRTSSFAVTSNVSNDAAYTNVFYKVGVCSINESNISTNELISKLLIQSIYVKSNKLFEPAAIYFPEWIPEILFAQTIKSTPVLSNATENIPCINNVIPLYLQSISSEESSSQGEHLVGLMYIKLYNEDGTEFESENPLTSNLYYNTESKSISEFYITFNNTQLESGKINSMLPSLSMFSNLGGMVAPVIPSYEG